MTRADVERVVAALTDVLGAHRRTEGEVPV
jgi:hypothetical protein